MPEGTAVDRGSNKKRKTEGERVEVARRPRWHHPGLHQENSSRVDRLVGLTRLTVVANFHVRNIFLPFSRHKFQGLRISSVSYACHSQSEFSILNRTFQKPKPCYLTPAILWTITANSGWVQSSLTVNCVGLTELELSHHPSQSPQVLSRHRLTWDISSNGQRFLVGCCNLVY